MDVAKLVKARDCNSLTAGSNPAIHFKHILQNILFDDSRRTTFLAPAKG